VAFVISDGSLATIGQDITPFGFPTRRGIAIGRHAALTYAQIYRTQPAVRMVVDFLARNLASLACQTFERTSDTDRKRLTMDESELAYMLEFSANPTTTGYRLNYGMFADRALYDTAYWLKIRSNVGEAPGFLRRIPPSRIMPVGGDWFEVDAYRIYGTKGFLDVPSADIVTFAGYDPEDTRRGVSPIESLRTILSEEYAATASREALWERGAISSGVISRPAEAPEWDTPARERFESDWAAYLLDGAKSGSAPVLEDGMTWQQAGYSPKDSQYVESRKLTREEVAAAYHIPPPLVGILDHATLSNIDEQHVQLYVDTLGPWTVSSEGEINTQLVPDFYDARKNYVEYNINAKLKGDFESQATMLQAAIGGPYMTRNEGRGRINLPAIEGGDELITPLNVTAGGQASPQDSAPDPADQNPLNPNDPAPPKRRGSKAAAPDAAVKAHVDMLAATFGRQLKSVIGKYAQASADTEVHQLFDLDRWNGELGADLYRLAAPLAALTGSTVAKSLGSPDGYEPDDTVHYLQAQTAGVAASINTVTKNQIATALLAHDVEAALSAVFALAIAQRAVEGGRTQATSVASWSTVEAGRQVAGLGARKRWLTGENPRPEHAKLNGETVGLDEHFSNGARWPGDSINLDENQVAGCNCDIEIIPEGVAA
jgi:HK97 family phage portal protein